MSGQSHLHKSCHYCQKMICAYTHTQQTCGLHPNNRLHMVNTNTHADTGRRHTHILVYTCTLRHTRARAHTHTHTHARARARARTQAQTHPQIKRNTHIERDTYPDTCTHTHTHTQTDGDTHKKRICALSVSCLPCHLARLRLHAPSPSQPVFKMDTKCSRH
jgi:hypothetical protein